MKEQIVCKQHDIQPGEMQEFTFGKVGVVLCRTPDGEFYAFMNSCIHQGAPLGKGKLCGATQSTTDGPGEYEYCQVGEIIRCPWHGREFDVKNEGKMLADSSKKLKSFNVRVEDDDVIVYK
ncbi:Rieske (2Fe-2S) protein [Pontibacillus salicampi]|uniref:Rieske (2Fe-2S) protein n=1 Tax=Pontibacillus salicampi TaxID=1449801 RepID=A0ABV6LTZ0_9BACI